MLLKNIEYKGKTYESKSGFELLSDEEYEKIVKLWYEKPNFKDVLIEMNDLRKGGIVLSKINEYYFRDLMDNTVKYYDKWSINDVIKHKPLLSVFVDKVNKNKKVFSCGDIVSNIDTAFRLGGKGIASKVSNFPLKVVDYVLYEYNTNGNWYDFSCGWGARLTGALKNKVNYFGTDPNYLLVEKLKEFSNDYRNNMGLKTSVDIRCQGSEHFIPEWENKIGLAFSSPPYFLLEDYKIGEQSYKEGTNYNDWLENYMRPTFKNIHKYLINEGYFIVNIKNFDGYTLEEDTVRIAQECGFYLYKIDGLEQAKRCSGSVGSDENTMVDVNENMYVFCKNGYKPKQCHDEQISLFDL